MGEVFHSVAGRYDLMNDLMSMGVQRRLAAILAADVVGYSRLIRADEEGTIATTNPKDVETNDAMMSEGCTTTTEESSTATSVPEQGYLL